MLQFKNVTKKFHHLTAVDDLSLSIEKGRIYAMLGPNGSGKTTLMKMAAGLVKPDHGEILLDEQPVGVETKKKIAYMPTESFFYPYMTGLDAGKYYHDFFEDFNMKKYQDLLSSMDLDPSQKISKMSSGMTAKLKIALTLSRDADIIMLDEPLNGIDIIARDQIVSTITTSFSPERSFLLSSHLVDELEKIIDYAVFMKKGVLVLDGPADDLRREKGISIVDLYREIYAD